MPSDNRDFNSLAFSLPGRFGPACCVQLLGLSRQRFLVLKKEFSCIFGEFYDKMVSRSRRLLTFGPVEGEQIMADMILGIGHQKSLVSVINLAEEHAKKTHGSPRAIVARSVGLEVHAGRPDFEGPFESFLIRMKLDEKLASRVKQFVAESADLCTLSEDGETVEVQCRCASHEQAAEMLQLIDSLSALLPLPEVWRIHGEEYRHEHLSEEKLFRAMLKFNASDVHLYPDAHPVFRIDNTTRNSEMLKPISAEQILAFVKEIAPERDWLEFEEHGQCSFTYHQIGLGYARVSAFIKSGVPHCTLRFLPETIPSFADINVPRETMEKLGEAHFGMILVTGMTGSGKSTTVASLVDWINTNKSVHILSIEEPIEYVHRNKKSIISQREVGIDVDSFNEAVKAALRHDPDVIFIGEMRDRDTIRSAINAAATGHLVISTLHANTASEVVNRVVSFFDPVERDLVKLQLRDCLQCVICQRLIPRLGGGRIPALEFMFNDTKHISDSILAGDSIGIRVGMQQTLSASFILEKYLHELVTNDIISKDDARQHAAQVDVLDQLFRGTYAIPSLESMMHSH